MLAPRDLKHAKAKRPKYEESMPLDQMVEDARASTPGPLTYLPCPLVYHFAWRAARAEHFSASHDKAIQTLANRLTILLGDCHVVCMNEISH